jgi:hypothetical protein
MGRTFSNSSDLGSVTTQQVCCSHKPFSVYSWLRAIHLALHPFYLMIVMSAFSDRYTVCAKTYIHCVEGQLEQQEIRLSQRAGV